MYRSLIILILLVACLAACKAKTKEELYSEGVDKIKQGNPGGAIVLLKNALEKDQNYLDARYQLAVAYMGAGKYEQAEKEFQKIVRQRPAYPGLKLNLAKLYVRLNKPDLAIPAAQDLLKDNPGSAEALEAVGIAYMSGNKSAEAENYLLKALQAEPGRSSSQLELATLYAATGRMRGAKGLINQVLKKEPRNQRAYYILAAAEISSGNPDAANAAYQKIARLYPSDTQALYKSGLLYLERGRSDKADKIAASMIEKFPKQAEGYRLKGIINYRLRNYSEAVNMLQASNKIRPTIESYYFLGLSSFGLGDMESALSQFRTILDRNPSFVRARLLTAVILLRQKRVDDSITEINKVLQINSGNAPAHNLLGSAYLAKGMYEEGMKELNRATELDPKMADAHVKKGLLLFGKGREREAETELTTAVRVAPDILNTRLLLSSYHIRRNEYAKALAVTSAGLNGTKSDAPLYNNMARIMFLQRKQPDALKYLAKAKATDPAFLPTYFNLANYYSAAGDYGRALAEYQVVLKKFPGNVRALLSSAAICQLKGNDKEALQFLSRAKDTKDPTAYLVLANYYLRKKDSDRALDVLDEAIKSSPRNAGALELKGRIFMGMKKYKKAINAFNDLESVEPDRGLPMKIGAYVAMKDYPKAVDNARRAITLKPASASGYIMLASVYESRNDVNRAIEEMKTAVRVDGKNPYAPVILGNLYARKGDVSSAMNCFAESLKRNPGFAAAYFARASLLEKTGKKREAIGSYREALEKSENHVPSLNNLAYLYADGYGDPKEALRLAITAYKLEPGSPMVMDTLGYVLLKNGRPAEAKKLLASAALQLPTNPTVHYHLAVACRDTGDRNGAAANLRKALQMGRFPEAAAARSMYDGLMNANSARRVK
ncbi:MAG: XrtA/PEP-CTERM system TPR-repeat protein PrsT [Geobacteraceae bacterium]|nr:XrtA/PEP-CTERM system TPR-repeat protein PrsT [Geobacteraceae bacterium]